MDEELDPMYDGPHEEEIFEVEYYTSKTKIIKKDEIYKYSSCGYRVMVRNIDYLKEGKVHYCYDDHYLRKAKKENITWYYVDLDDGCYNDFNRYMKNHEKILEQKFQKFILKYGDSQCKKQIGISPTQK